jgi:hypothetical protein
MLMLITALDSGCYKKTTTENSKIKSSNSNFETKIKSSNSNFETKIKYLMIFIPK